MLNSKEYTSEILDVQVILLQTRDRDVLLKRHDHRDAPDEEPKWFPLSMDELSDNGDGTHTLTCPEWKLKKEGWL